MAKGDKIDENLEQVAPQQRKLRFTEEGIKTHYSGIFNVGLGAEEVILMFGNPSIDPDVIHIESKIAVSLKTAASKISSFRRGTVRKRQIRSFHQALGFLRFFLDSFPPLAF